MKDEKPRGDRIQKILARAGVSSRREAETLITEGRVTVNGQPAELGQKADPEHDSIKLDGKRILLPREHRYLLLNKPRGVMTTVADPGGRPTVIDLVPPALRKALVPVGRLDFLTEGLILLTDDGDFANRVAHPRYGCRKTYEVKVSGRPAERDLDRLREGIVLEGERTAPCRIEPRSMPRAKGADGENSWWNVELSQGRTRQIREMFQRIGHPVGKLRRVAIGGLTDPNLPLGAIRELSPREVEMLRQGSRASDPLAGASSGRGQKGAGTSERFPEIRRWRAKGEEKAADLPRAERPARPERPERPERAERPERPEKPERITRTLLLPRLEEVPPAAPRRAGTASRAPGEERGGRPAPRPPRSVSRAERPAEHSPRGGFGSERSAPSAGRPVRSPLAARPPRAVGGIPGAPRPRSGPYPPPGADFEERGKPLGRPSARPGGRPTARPGASDRPVRPSSARPGAKPSGRPSAGRPPAGRPTGRPSAAAGGRPSGRPTAGRSERPASGRPASGRPASGRPSSGRPAGRPTSGRPSGKPAGRPAGGGRPGGKPGGRKGR